MNGGYVIVDTNRSTPQAVGTGASIMDYAIQSHRIEVVAPLAVEQTAPIDLAHLRRFTMGNRALELEVLCLFSRDTPSLLDRLAQARDEKSWLEAAHTLKGSARAIGAKRVGALAEQAERAGRAGDRAPDLLASLRDALREAMAFVDAHATNGA